MERGYISVELAARLLGYTPRLIRQKIADGQLPAVSVEGELGGGQNGIVYRVPVDALPYEAQILYYSAMSDYAQADAADLAGYRVKYGEDALRELLRQQKWVQAADGIRKSSRKTVQAELTKLADEAGTTLRTLYRWEKAYEQRGIAGLMRKGRSDAGESRTMCLECRRQVIAEYLTPERRAQAAILRKVRIRAREMGVEACEHCPYHRGSDNRDALIGSGELAYYPECDKAGNGILVPDNVSAINRVISSVSEEEKTYMRRGRKAWEAAHMMKATRAKPEAVNEVWFGDHGQFDVFVIDHDGKIVRPWLTAWYDGGSGCLVGWTISTNPNSRTITQAFVRAAASKFENPIKGVPKAVYVDNGKDYRCEALEGGTLRWQELGKIDHDIGSSPLYEALQVQVLHAKAYHGWVKPIERFFRTLWEAHCRELPGYCGGSPDKRPENFERTLQKLAMRGELLTLDELAYRFQNEIIPAYHNEPHSGYGGRKPAEMYALLPRARNYVPSWSALALVMEEKAERKVSTQGIRLENRLYWSHKLMHVVGDRVVVRYERDMPDQIMVCTLKGQYICMAEPKELLRMVGEDAQKVAIHVAMQRVQERELREKIRARGVKLPGKRASGHIYYEAVDENSKGNGNIISVAAEMAARDREALDRGKNQRKRMESGEDRTGAMFRRMYEQMTREQQAR